MVTDLMINHNRPLVMHIDLNSCFATATQQAFPHLRGKPMVVAAYDSPRGCILASSIEAKKLGIKTGMRVMEENISIKISLSEQPIPTWFAIFILG